MVSAIAFLALTQLSTGTWLTGANIMDGSGRGGFIGSVLIEGDQIKQVVRGSTPKLLPGQQEIKLGGYILAPGFIDSHSHADGRIAEDPNAVSQVTQGITTAVVGQDGFLPGPFVESMAAIQKVNPAINFAAFSGHNSLRLATMGKNPLRVSTPGELAKMQELLEVDMKAGALGLSSGLEYNPGFFSTTEEVIELAKVAAKYKGSYISHIRSEDREFDKAVAELNRIAYEANIPAQISHIKLAMPKIWGRSGDVIRALKNAREAGIRVSADIYPYTYWQSTITVITNSRKWDDVNTWKTAIEETGGADKILLTRYTPDTTWQGKTIAQIAAQIKRKPEEVVLEIVQKTTGKNEAESESVIVTSMTESDIANFLQWNQTSICSDGGIGGSHPRGAGSFPRVLGRYVREGKTLALQDAVRRMTSLPASRFGFKDRGRIRAGFKADLVAFDANRVKDTATPENPTSLSVGIEYVWVNGVNVVNKEKPTGNRGGKILLRGGSIFTAPAGTKTTLNLNHSFHCCGG